MWRIIIIHQIRCDMIHYIKELEAKINLYIREVESEEINPMNRSLSISNKLEEAIGGLKAFIKTYSFKDIREEIRFFKEIKPRIHCRLIYYRKVYNLELNRPLGGMTNNQNYFQWELEHIQEYINKHLDFYRYYRSGVTYMDELYFVRGTKPVSNMYLDSFSFERDPQFSTEGDFMVAKILAYDLLQQYLIGELLHLEESDIAYRAEARLTWTESKTDLCELIFALHAKGVFGHTPLTRLANYIQKVFNVELNSNFSRTFNDISLRNDPTPFLDSLTDALLEKMKRPKRRR